MHCVWTHLRSFLFSTLLYIHSSSAVTTDTINPPQHTTNPFMAAPTIASSYSLTTSTSLPFPTATLSNSDTKSLLVADWSLSKGRIQNGAGNVAFVADPFPTDTLASDSSDPSINTTAPVLRVTYSGGGFGPSNGTQLYSLWNSSSGFQSMLLTYEVAFDTDFPWVQGGKLPGLRGGSDVNSCDGGSESNGDCFSTRIMWRKQAEGEAYAYMLTPHNTCSSSDFICNSDFGVSIDRGAFTFQSGQWNRISLLVQLNSAPHTANGLIQVYFNDVRAISQPNLQFSNTSGLTIGGLFFSTFFGGDDASWAPPNDTHTYFRNVQLWGGSSPSNLTSTGGASAISFSWLTGVALLVVHLARWVS